MTDNGSQQILRDLHRSLDERWSPEDVADKMSSLLDMTTSEKRGVLNKAVRAKRWKSWSSMSDDFKRPVDMTRQLKVASELFDHPVSFPADDLAKIETWIKTVEDSIGKRFGSNDFKHDRLSKQERHRLGIEISRRQYNKRFRLAVRFEQKMERLAREQLKRSLTLASKSRLASQIEWEDFSSDPNTACFIAYYVARCNLRSVFTNTSQIRPYDEICEMLMSRCCRHPEHTNWWAIAHVHPIPEVLQFLDDEQKGVLLGAYFDQLATAAALLRELWDTNQFSSDMVVQRGNDSTTWNVTAGAWNKLRDGWVALLYSLGMDDSVEEVCPGKVLRLMAADVAYWHRATRGDVHPDTHVWQQLPRPWEVLSGTAACSKSFVEDVCRKFKVDPVKSGWTAPRTGRRVEKFTPTPELVHGVAVSSPALAKLFRQAGVFSGKAVTEPVSLSTVNEIRWRHLHQQEQRRETT